MNEKKLSRPLISLIVSIALIIVGIAGSFILQTNSGKTTIRNVTIESESGHTLAMDVYIPENATAETPAPAIFVQHGGNNNKEEMQHYCIKALLPADGIGIYSSTWLTAKLIEQDKLARSLVKETVDAGTYTAIEKKLSDVKDGNLLTGDCKFQWMQTINLKQYYPFCKEDIFVEVSDEIVEAFLLDKRAEAARDRKMFRYKAFYSLDCNDGIENAAIGWAQPSPEDYLIEKEELAEYEELIRRLYEAISSLPPMQARRVHARYMLGMLKNEIQQM